MVSATIAFLFSSVQQNCSWSCLCFLSLVLFFPFPLNQTQSDLCLFYSTKFAIGRITNGFHVSRSYGQLSIFILAELSATSFTISPVWYIFFPQLSRPYTLGFSPSHCSLLLSSLFSASSSYHCLKVGGPRAQFLVFFSCLSPLGFTPSYGFNCHLYVNSFPIYISSSSFFHSRQIYPAPYLKFH